MKRDKFDKAVSDLVRARDDWTCQKCGIVDEDAKSKGSSMVMQNSHIYSRKHMSTRYDLDNCICLCASCHAWLESRPLEHADFARNHLGDGLLEILREKHHRIKKWTVWEKGDMLKHYQKELRGVKEKRLNGIGGCVEVVNYD